LLGDFASCEIIALDSLSCSGRADLGGDVLLRSFPTVHGAYLQQRDSAKRNALPCPLARLVVAHPHFFRHRGILDVLSACFTRCRFHICRLFSSDDCFYSGARHMGDLSSFCISSVDSSPMKALFRSLAACLCAIVVFGCAPIQQRNWDSRVDHQKGCHDPCKRSLWVTPIVLHGARIDEINRVLT